MFNNINTDALLRFTVFCLCCCFSVLILYTYWRHKLLESMLNVFFSYFHFSSLFNIIHAFRFVTVNWSKKKKKHSYIFHTLFCSWLIFSWRVFLAPKTKMFLKRTSVKKMISYRREWRQGGCSKKCQMVIDPAG